MNESDDIQNRLKNKNVSSIFRHVPCSLFTKEVLTTTFSTECSIKNILETIRMNAPIENSKKGMFAAKPATERK